MYEKEIRWLKEAKSSSCDGVDCLYHVEGEDCGGICIKALDAAVKTLENQDKYRWHDLRKNPEDLPANNSIVLTYLGNGSVPIYVVQHYKNKWQQSINVIAWSEIDPFEEEK